MLFAGLFAAIVVYPVLHEFGHILIAFLLGVKIEDVNLFSELSVVCMADNAEPIKVALIGYGGIIIPVVFEYLISFKWFVFRYISFSIKVINIIAIVNAYVSLVLFVIGRPSLNNDITVIMSAYNNGLQMTVIVLIISLYFSIISFRDNNIMNDFYHFVQGNDT